VDKSEAEKKLLEMLVSDEIIGYGIEGDEITIFVLKGRSEVIDKIREVFGETSFNITIIEVEEELRRLVSGENKD